MLLDVNNDLQTWRILGAGLLFAVVFPATSFLLNRRGCRRVLVIEAKDVIFMAALVFLLAILVEATLNPFYTALVGEKLWVYRLLPLHDGNVSALAVLVWTSYGVHLYFLNQTLDSRIAVGARRNLIKATLIGMEAPLLWEVLGNGFFLLTADEFYAYYLPGDLLHLTSLRVIPWYALAIYIGLNLHERLRVRAADWRLTAGLFTAGIAFLGAG